MSAEVSATPRTRRPGSAIANLVTIFLALLAALAIADGLDLWRMTAFQLGRRDTAEPLRNAIVYAGAYLLGVVALTVLLGHRSWIRWPTLVVGAVSVALVLALRSLNGEGFTHHEAALFWTELQRLPEALRYFFPSWAPFALVVAIATGAAGFALARIEPPLRSPVWLIVPILCLALQHEILERTYGKVYQFPAPERVALLTWWAFDHRMPYYGPRDELTARPSGEPLAPHIVLVMDESVSGDLLGINGGPPETTPRIGSRPAVFNYGVASAISNLSSNTNIGLLGGLRPDQIPDPELRALKNPSLFDYMQNAGYRVHYIDAQNYSDRPQNLMSRFDIDRIDRLVNVRGSVEGSSESRIDFDALPFVRDAITGSERSFVYLLKTGAHFPYVDKYDRDRPAFASQEAFDARHPDLAAVPVDYVNALAWTIDEHLASLVATLEETGRDVLVVYTSDHGQSFDPTAGSRSLHHAVVDDPPMVQAAVPLLLLAIGDRVTNRIEARFHPHLVDRTSGFEIFPTLLQAAGYTREDVPGLYTSLFEADVPRPERSFLSGNLFSQEGGFYIYNPTLGGAGYRNEFSIEGASRSTQ
jgi:hypothetical protein